MSSFQKITFFFILVLAVFFRFYRLDQFPPSLNWDEISHGYNAYSLIQTGKDQWNQSWPIFNFRAYGDYPTTLNLYLTLPLVKLFGLNPITTRLPSAFLGFLLVPATFFLCQKLFKNYYLSLIAAFVVAVSPWTIFTSRAVFQSTVAQFFLVAGIALLFTRRLTLGTILMALSVYGYHNTRIIALPLFIVFILIFRRQITITKKHLFIFLLITLPCLLSLFSPESRARSQWVSIINPSAVNLINENRRLFSGSPFIARLIYNKGTYFVPRFVKNYLDFFNPYLLFFKGSTNFQFNVPDTGLFFPIFLPFFYIGFLSLIKNRHQTGSRLILVWYFIGLFPAAITAGDFPVIRAMSILPLPQIIIALGLLAFSRYLIYLVILISLFQLNQYWSLYTINYRQNYSSSWQYGYRQAVDYLRQNYSAYDQILFTKKYGEPHEFILFYWPWNPKSFQQDPNLNWDYHTGWYWVNAFAKFKFINDWEMKDQTISLHRTLVITGHQNYQPENAKLLETITFLDGSPAFDIVAYD